MIGQLRQELSAAMQEVRARTCGSSSARWSWSLTGGDARPFTEINTAQQLIRPTRSRPDQRRTPQVAGLVIVAAPRARPALDQFDHPPHAGRL
ncbi:MAG: hypothetical protein M3257_03535 [Actinomycetota bacterium]|nr:hypothetical protein [Actinomycetota bacterium]